VTAEEVDHLLLATRQGKPIYLSDVAKVRATFKDRTSFSRLNMSDNITLSIQKRAGANVVEISDRIKGILDYARKQVPDAVKFDITFDMSNNIRTMVADLENNILAALILVTGILVIFMGWRTSMIVAMIIPLSMLMTFFLYKGRWRYLSFQCRTVRSEEKLFLKSSTGVLRKRKRCKNKIDFFRI